MKGLLFLTLFIVLGYIAFTFTTKEGFQSRLESEKGIVKVPLNIPAPKTVDVSSPAPYMLPADKEYGPAFGEVARVNSLPYRDPALETATYKRLEELRQSLAGFLAFEAKGLQDQGDPAIQLPLSTLRGDFQRLTDEVSVLKRNPGLNSQLTLRDVGDIQSNLNYLQKKYRLSVNAISYDGSSLEGFEDASGGAVADLASQKDVETAILRVKAEILRLSKSSTTDPVIKGRVAVLTRIQQKMEEIVRDLKTGVRTKDQIPILKKDLEEFLPVAGDTSKPINKFLDENNLPNTLQNLFPAYEAGDISGARLAGYLFDTYADTIVKGLSWSVGLKYTSPNEAAAGSGTGSGFGSSVSGTGLTTGDDTTVNNLYSLFNENGSAGTQENLVGPSSDFSSPGSFARGEFENSTNPSRNKAAEASQYDWKTKAGQICEAVRRQGLNPKDFGCLDSSASVGADYSWRGNARMVCTRLQSSFNTALPELCGCPPMDWPGWRS